MPNPCLALTVSCPANLNSALIWSINSCKPLLPALFLSILLMTHGFDDENDGIDAAQRFGDVLIEAVVQSVAVFGLEAGGIDENELCGVVGVNAGNAVARGLGFFTGDADFLPDEVVHQRGLADVGAADDGDEAAAVVGGMAGFVLQEGFDVHDGFLFDVSDDLFVLS